MSENVSEYILRRLLQDWGVKRIFGYAGDGIIGFLGAMRGQAGVDRPHFVQARHEEMAAFMACAHAKFSDGEVGVPPLPPHITVEQAQSFMYALMRGDPSASGMIVQSAKQKLEEFLPGR